MYKHKKVLVTGSEGLIGRELVKLLRDRNADVYTSDLRLGQNLAHYSSCLAVTQGMDYVFHLVGVKGSPQMTKTKPVDFMAPMLQCDTNMILASQTNNVKRFLYTSSIALLNLNTDYFPATAKNTAEILTKAMHVQYPTGTKYCIVRPASVYGPYENWEREGLMFISKMIKQAVIEKKDLELWNDGESVRDVIHARDVARAMIQTMEDMPNYWRPIGSGKADKLVDIAQIIAEESGVNLKIGPPGEKDSRTMDLNWDFKPKIDLREGIREVIEYVRNNYHSNKR